MKVGFAQTDITPSIQGRSIGSVHPRPITGVHDPLLAVACVIDDGISPRALVGIDAGLIVRATADSAAAQIAASTGVAGERVIISASHTHQGGPTHTLFNTVADPAYATQTAAGIAVAVKRAWEARRDCVAASDFGRVSGIHFNRRFLMRDGTEVTHPGKMNAEIVRPAGPVDEKIGVLAFRDAASGGIAGLVVNFGCHCTVTEDGTEYSADYVYYLREHVKRLIPGSPPVVFLLGACGDVTQIDNRSTAGDKGHPHADRMGAVLAEEVARAVLRMNFTTSPPAASPQVCRFAEETHPVAIRDRDAAAKPPTRGLGSGAMWEGIYASEREHVAAIRAKTPNVDFRIRAANIGDLAIVSNGAELFCQPAIDIQSASPFAKTWVVALANEYLGYVPTASAHVAGGYEPRLARSSFLAIDGAQKIVEASLRALGRLG